MTAFTATEPQIASLVQAYPLAWVLSGTAGEMTATPLPLMGEHDSDGAIVGFFGHFARSNRQVALLEREPRATILFQGPQGYISPRLVSKETWGATWNYVVARFEVDIRFVPDETGESVWQLAAALEGDGSGAWTPDRMGPRYAELLRYIVAFRATVRATSARFKLGQDEARQTFEEIVVGLGDTALARWMRMVAADAPGHAAPLRSGESTRHDPRP